MYFDEKILEVKEIFDDECEQEGFIIKTTKQEIFLTIAKDAEWGSCCEKSGYLISEDDFGKYIGKELYKISITNDRLENTEIKINSILNSVPEDYLEHRSMKCVFINIDTEIGVLQFTAYNIDGGYYGHEVNITSKRFVLKDVI